MIEYVNITNDKGETLVLEPRSPEKSGFFIRGIEGLGPPKTNVALSDAVGRDGALYNSSRMTSRNLVFDLGFYDGQESDIELARQQTYRYFPSKKPVSIEIKTTHRHVYTSGYVETNEPDIFSNNSATIISLICPDAYFYGTEIIETVFSGITPGFEFPFENTSLTEATIQFGTVFINTESNVFYTGDVETGVSILIKFLGPVNDLTIINNSTGETMAIDSDKVIAIVGSNFTTGDQVIISTVRGDKFIYLLRNGQWYNILNSLSNLATWFVIDRGDNVFTYTAQSGLSNLQFLIQHQIVYKGV